MRRNNVAAFVGVLVAVLLVTQLAFTAVGSEVGSAWSNPREVAVVDPGADEQVTDLAAADGSDDGVIAWIEQRGDSWYVRAARTTIEDGRVSIQRTRTLETAGGRLSNVDVGAHGDTAAVSWERNAEDDVVVAHLDDGRPRVVGSALRIEETSVAVGEGGTFVGWRALEDRRFHIGMALLRDDGVLTGTLDRGTDGVDSPSVEAVGDRFAVIWWDVDDQVVRGTSVRPDGGTIAVGKTGRLGDAHSGSGFGSSGSFSLATSSNGTAVRAAWMDVGHVTTAVAADGVAVTGKPARLGTGERPGIASRDDRWLATWLVEGRNTGTDIVFATRSADGRDDGVVSRLTSSANNPHPMYAPDPAVAWTERGTRHRVLISAYRPVSSAGPVERIGHSPGRFVFVALAGVLVGTVMVPFMPWTFVALLGSFYLTNRVIRTRLVRLAARLGSLAGRDVGDRDVEQWTRDLSPRSLFVAFVVGETLLLVLLIGPSVRASTLAFSNPLGVTILGIAATLVVGRVVGLRSPWHLTLTFVYFQTVGLWVTAIPSFM